MTHAFAKDISCFYHDLFFRRISILEEKLIKPILIDQVREEMTSGDHLNKDFHKSAQELKGHKFVVVILISLQYLEGKCSKPSMNPHLFLTHWGEFNDTGHLPH